MQHNQPIHLFSTFPALEKAADQRARRAQTVRVAGHLARACFNENGQWKLTDYPSPDTRERVWLCFALMQGDAADQALGNAILADTTFESTPVGYVAQETAKHFDPNVQPPFDIFVTNHAVQMVALHAAKLTPAVRTQMEAWARIAFNDAPGDRQPNFQFHGFNDNFPAKSSFGLILGGEYFGNADAVAHGLWNLRQCRDLLTRRGLLSEYNSPTYSPVTLISFTEIAEYAKNAEARDLATQCAWRVWADLLGHFHLPTSLLAGPFSRAYTTDSLGHLSSVHYLLWQTFGDRFVRWHPLEELLQKDPRLVIHHCGDIFFAVAQLAWFGSVDYHPPTEVVQWMEGRTYPYRIVATGERGERLHSWGASEVLTTCYQTEDFALGSSQGDWGMQSEELYLLYRRQSAIAGPQDVRTVYPRYLFDEEAPGKIIPNHNALFTGEEDYLPDHGRYQVIQHDEVALLSVSPHENLAGKPTASLRCSILFPEHFGVVPVLEFSDGHIWIEDGPVYVALRPLGATDWGRRDAVRLETVNRYRVVSLINYEGPKRAFTLEDLHATVNGFVMIVGSAKAGTFAEFRRRVLDAELLDYLSNGSRVVRYRIGDLQMEIGYGVGTGGVRFATINGKPIPRPIWQADGMPAERLPFLDAPPRPNSFELPHRNYPAIGDMAIPGVIFSRGKNR